MITTAALLGGLPPRTLQEIAAVLRRFPDIRWVKLYSSRGLGRQRSGSDIDLAISVPIDHSTALAAAFEELPTPYLLDVDPLGEPAARGTAPPYRRLGGVLVRLSWTSTCSTADGSRSVRWAVRRHLGQHVPQFHLAQGIEACRASGPGVASAEHAFPPTRAAGP